MLITGMTEEQFNTQYPSENMKAGISDYDTLIKEQGILIRNADNIFSYYDYVPKINDTLCLQAYNGNTLNDSSELRSEMFRTVQNPKLSIYTRADRAASIEEGMKEMILFTYIILVFLFVFALALMFIQLVYSYYTKRFIKRQSIVERIKE